MSLAVLIATRLAQPGWRNSVGAMSVTDWDERVQPTNVQFQADAAWDKGYKPSFIYKQ
ncbi:MAG: hypothetical protein NWQ54_11900 [Paraglaciecola sp.]|nr:hypothetical protein [Paraglaciecola sp.]